MATLQIRARQGAGGSGDAPNTGPSRGGGGEEGGGGDWGGGGGGIGGGGGGARGRDWLAHGAG